MSKLESPAAPAARAAGFTLVEMLAVMLIVAILFTFVVTRVMGGRESVEIESTRSFLRQLEASIHEFEGEKGDYPRSTFPSDLDPQPSKANMGAEMLVISFAPADGSWQAMSLPDDRLGNSDGDNTKKSLTRFTNADVFELQDDWGNPIAYLHRRDYAEGQTYVTFDPGSNEVFEENVKAAVNPVTGDPYNPDTFQLLSAGPDGRFGTEDDIGNFEPQG